MRVMEERELMSKDDGKSEFDRGKSETQIKQQPKKEQFSDTVFRSRLNVQDCVGTKNWGWDRCYIVLVHVIHPKV